MRLVLVLIALLGVSNSWAKPFEFKAMTWNIWHGGKEDGADLGPQRIIDVIRDSGADLVAMQETYGSGELIAKGLGFHFQPRGTNVSIHSRFPVIEDISVFQEFKCVGALVQLPNGTRVAFYSIWLPFGGEIWAPGTRDVNDLGSMFKACAPSEPDLKQIHDLIAPRLQDARYAGVPIVIAGDFNSMSHLDYGEIGRPHYNAVVDWPTSHVLHRAGFRDSYREMNPMIDREEDRTWSPRFRNQEKDRIDFIFHKGLTALSSNVIDRHQNRFPSDHAAVVTTFALKSGKPEPQLRLRAGSYNILHGKGMDERVDLDRTAGVLRKLNADFIGLQEVDQMVKRSGSTNQAAELGKRLGYHAAFGAFMPYDGGHYGMGLLSRHPFTNVRSLRLKEGNEPRVALAADIRLPSDEVITVINVHFDWVEDDGFRFEQATQVADFLKALPNPYVVLGDFNDQPGSRTINLFRGFAVEAKKAERSRFTYSSTKPEKEIDFTFASPNRWKVGAARVIDERMASDHRPIVTELTLTPRL